MNPLWIILAAPILLILLLMGIASWNMMHPLDFSDEYPDEDFEE
jgi:hypothetical protein